MVSIHETDSLAPGPLEERSRELFENSVEGLDARTRSRLNQARQRALDELKKSSTHRHWLGIPLGALAAGALIAVLLIRGGGELGAPPLENGGLPLDDFDIVADADSFELLQDVELYSWLAQHGTNSG